MAKPLIPPETEPCCELCEHFTRMEATNEALCKYKNRLKKVSEDSVCKKFSFDIFAYKPRTPSLPKAFDFTKI